MGKEKKTRTIVHKSKWLEIKVHIVNGLKIKWQVKWLNKNLDIFFNEITKGNDIFQLLIMGCYYALNSQKLHH